jgi:threonine dehydratase
MFPSLSTARDAQKLLAKYLPVTPLQTAPSLSSERTPVYLKLETALPTGSFKPRGALYALVTRLAQGGVKEVTASSTGNHGAAVAFAAKTLGVPATIFLPANPIPVKRQRILDLGAHVVEEGAQDLAAASARASEYSRRPGVYFLSDATDPILDAGTAVIALEIFEQVPQVSSIYVPMGDTALIRGIAAAAKQLAPQTRIVGVQAEPAPSYYLSWKAGRAISTDTCDTIADGLATRLPTAENVRAICELVDDVLLVTEERMIEAIAHLHSKEGVLAEPAGAAATAAFLGGAETDGNVVLLVTGANISDEVRKRAGI